MLRRIFGPILERKTYIVNADLSEKSLSLVSLLHLDLCGNMWKLYREETNVNIGRKNLSAGTLW